MGGGAYAYWSTSKLSPRTSLPSLPTSSCPPATMPNASTSVKSLDCCLTFCPWNLSVHIVLIGVKLSPDLGQLGPSKCWPIVYEYSFSNFAPALWTIFCCQLQKFTFL